MSRRKYPPRRRAAPGGGHVKATADSRKKSSASGAASLKTPSIDIPTTDVGFAPDRAYEGGEIIVANPPKNFSASVGALGFSILESVRLEALEFDIYRLRVPRTMSVPEARKVLRTKYPGVSIDANHLFEAQGVEDYPKNTPRALIGWRPATPGCGGGIRIGMIDASVDVKHPALKGQRIEFRSFHKAGRRPGPAEHGTAVAGILVGKPKWGGLLPGAELMAANMFEVNESGRVVGNGIALLKAINWLSQKRVQVINLSVAGADNKVVRKALQRSKKKGMVLVAAAGNWQKKGNKPAYPAAYNDVLAVTAFGSDRLIYSQANTGKYIDFAAPGVKVYTAVPGGGRIQSGTSFASPFISVLLALQLERGAAKKSSVLRDFLRGHALDLGRKGQDEVFGYGFVNLQPKCT